MDIHSVVTSEVCLSYQLFCMHVCMCIDMEPNLCHIGNFVFVLIKTPPMEAHLSYQDARFGKAIFETEPSLTTDPKESQFCSKMVIFIIIFFYHFPSFAAGCLELFISTFLLVLLSLKLLHVLVLNQCSSSLKKKKAYLASLLSSTPFVYFLQRSKKEKYNLPPLFFFFQNRKILQTTTFYYHYNALHPKTNFSEVLKALHPKAPETHMSPNALPIPARQTST